jgi:deoxyribonuclease V
MLACVDVDYRGDEAVAACVLFKTWQDEKASSERVERIRGVAPYQPGQFYRRELPCLLAVLAPCEEPLDLVLIDGYVWLGEESHPGLGAHLYEALQWKVPIVGVAKTQFLSARRAVAVSRGETSRKPLFVTAAGIDVAIAAANVQAMHGAYRLPTLLKRVDQLCRTAQP